MKTYMLQNAHRTWTLKVSELPNEIRLLFSVSVTGDFDDYQQFASWWQGVAEQYREDRRPVFLRNQDTGETVRVR